MFIIDAAAAMLLLRVIMLIYHTAARVVFRGATRALPLMPTLFRGAAYITCFQMLHFRDTPPCP